MCPVRTFAATRPVQPVEPDPCRGEPQVFSDDWRDSPSTDVCRPGTDKDRARGQAPVRRTPELATWSVGPLRYAAPMANEPRYVLHASDHPKPMGETLLEYARPLFPRLPQDHTFAELKAMIMFAAVVWNIGLLSEVSDAVAYLARKMPRRLRPDPPQALAAIRPLATGRESSF